MLVLLELVMLVLVLLVLLVLVPLGLALLVLVLLVLVVLVLTLLVLLVFILLASTFELTFKSALLSKLLGLFFDPVLQLVEAPRPTIERISVCSSV